MTEPEEIIEARLVDLLAAALPGWDVIGALTPALEGEMKQSPDTHVSVFVDQSGQPYYGCDADVPLEYTARVCVRLSNADDKSGVGFRDACRAVREVLDVVRRTHCEAFAGTGFVCSAFRVESTSTEPLMIGESGGMVKTYNAVLTGITPTETQQEQEG